MSQHQADAFRMIRGWVGPFGSNRPRRRKPRGPRVEALEGRLLLAGSVAADEPPIAVKDAPVLICPPLLGTTRSQPWVEGLPTSGVVATFFTYDPPESIDDLKATIDWGDGTTSKGVVQVQDAGMFDIVAPDKIYDQAGTYEMVVKAVDAQGKAATVSTNIEVAPAPDEPAGIPEAIRNVGGPAPEVQETAIVERSAVPLAVAVPAASPTPVVATPLPIPIAVPSPIVGFGAGGSRFGPIGNPFLTRIAGYHRSPWANHRGPAFHHARPFAATALLNSQRALPAMIAPASFGARFARTHSMSWSAWFRPGRSRWAAR